MAREDIGGKFDDTTLDAFAERIEDINTQIDALLAEIASAKKQGMKKEPDGIAHWEEDDGEESIRNGYEEEFEQVSFEARSLYERLPRQ
jgi:hypothetical protein